MIEVLWLLVDENMDQKETNIQLKPGVPTEIEIKDFREWALKNSETPLSSVTGMEGAVANEGVVSLDQGAFAQVDAPTSSQQDPPKVQSAIEQALRSEKRIQDDPVILAKLGFKGDLPSIPAKLLEECACTSGTLVLKFKTTALDYQAKLNEALGSDKMHLHLLLRDGAEFLATTDEEPSWINVPNTVRDDTLGKCRSHILESLPGCKTCDGMDTILMLGYNNLQNGRQLAGFTDKMTFTNITNLVVGSNAYGIRAYFRMFEDGPCHSSVGLAPRLVQESRI